MGKYYNSPALAVSEIMQCRLYGNHPSKEDQMKKNEIDWAWTGLM